MKAKFLFAATAVIVVAGFAPSASGAACSTFTNLASLLTAGTCDVGSVTFNNFNYTNTAVAASSVSVAAAGSGAQGAFAGLAFQTTGGWVPDPTFSLTYQLTCNGCTLIGAQVNANIQPVFGSPAATMTLTFTDAGGVLTPTAGTQNQSHFVGYSQSEISNILNAGGPADNLQSLQNNFYIAAPTPEPTTVTLLGGGLLLMGLVRMRRT